MANKDSASLSDENDLVEQVEKLKSEESPTESAHEAFKDLPRKLLDSKYEMEVQEQCNGNPTNTADTFEDLKIRPELLKGLYTMGFKTPSKFQKTALPILLADPPQNMIAQFQCGMGKTTAFVLASLCRVDPNTNCPQVLVLSPSTDLAIQTSHVAKQITRFCSDIKIQLAIRGRELEHGQKVKAQVIIGTPEKVLDWMVRYHFFDIKNIKVFVLDEADVMFDTYGHKEQSIRIHKSLSKSCQVLLFLPTYKKKIMEVAEQLIQNAVVVCLRTEEYLDNIKQYYVHCKDDEAKFNAISNIYGVIAIGKAIIFCHIRKTAMWLVEKMVGNGYSVGLLSGDLTVDQRISLLNNFRKGKIAIMVTTDVCARAVWKWYPYNGIDVEQVSIVVNFDLPMDLKRHANCEIYLHRIGRTGYFNKRGLIINMVDGKQNIELLRQVEEHFGHKIYRLDANNPDEIEKILQE